MRIHKKFINIVALFACLFCLALTAQAQKRKPTTKTTTTTSVTNNAEVKAGAEKVSIQIKNVSKFVYNLAIVGRSIEDLDVDIKAGKASQRGVETNNKNKQAVIAGLKNIRAGLAALEVEFRTKPSLRAYLLKVDGITALCGQAEDLAATGRYIDSGKPLLSLIEKLSDALVAMP